MDRYKIEEETKARILLVDDDSSLSRLFQYSLKKSGYECRTAMNGQEGYEAALEWLPDLIISDVMMPVASGFEFRKMVLKEPSLSKIPFIFLTAKSGDDDIAVGKELGVAGFVIKTEGPKVLVSRVDSILGFAD